jgi:hypothetical protein
LAAPPKITTPAQVLKFRFLHELGTGKLAGTSMYFVYTGGRPSPGDCGTLATDAATAWNSNCAALYTHNGLLTHVICQDIFDTAGNETDVAVSHAGTRGGDQPWVGACATVLYKVSQHFRGGKFKGFWPFGIEGDSSNQSDWGPTFIAAVNTGVSALAAAITGASSGSTVVAGWTAVSFYHGKQANTDVSPWAPKNMPAPRSTSVQYPILSPACGTLIGSQRRRRS